MILGASFTTARAQNPDVDTDYYFANVLAGGGIGSVGTSRTASGQAGGSAGMGTISSRVGGLGFQQFLEAGAIGPLAARNNLAGFLSYDLGTNVLVSRNARYIPFAVAGYSYLFGGGNAINFGIGVDHYYKFERAIRLEVRDYYTLPTIHQHSIAVRIAWCFGAHDT